MDTNKNRRPVGLGGGSEHLFRRSAAIQTFRLASCSASSCCQIGLMSIMVLFPYKQKTRRLGRFAFLRCRASKSPRH